MLPCFEFGGGWQWHLDTLGGMSGTFSLLPPSCCGGCEVFFTLLAAVSEPAGCCPLQLCTGCCAPEA